MKRAYGRRSSFFWGGICVTCWENYRMFVHTCCSLQNFGPMFSYGKGGVVVKWRRLKEMSE